MNFLLFFFIIFNLYPPLIDKIEDAGSIGNKGEQINGLKIILPEARQYPDTLAYIYYKIAFRYEQADFSESVDSAIKYYALAHELFLKKDCKNKKTKNDLNLAYLYYIKNDSQKAFSLLKGIVTSMLTDEERMSYLNRLFSLALESNNVKLAQNLSDMLLLLSQKINDKPFIAIGLLNKGNVYESFDINLAIETYLKGIDFCGSDEELLSHRIRMLNNLAILYRKKGKYKLAIEAYNKVISLSKEINIKEIALNNLGLAYAYNGQFEKAFGSINKALNIRKKVTPPDFVKLSSCEKHLAEVFILQKEFKLANVHNRSAIQYLAEDNDVNGGWKLTKAQLDQFGTDINMLLIYKLQELDILLKLSKDGQDTNTLNHSLLSEIDVIIDKIRSTQMDEKSKLVLREQSFEFYKTAVKACLNQRLIEKALYFSEKAKSVLLVENYLRLSNEKSILRFYEFADKLSLKNEQDSVLFDKCISLIPDVISTMEEKAKKEISAPIETYTAYNQLLSKGKSEHAYISYLDIGREMIAFVISDKIKVVRMTSDETLKEMVLEYIENVKHKGDLCLSNYIYEALVSPLGNLPTNLTILPDSYLNFLSFESLVSLPVNDYSKFNTLPFMVKGHIIAYNYSLGMVKLMSDKKLSEWRGVVFAPKFDFGNEGDGVERGKSLPPLPFAKKEALEISKLMGYDTYIAENADRAAFISSFNKAGVVHFSGHAIIDVNDPYSSYLAFNSSASESSRLYLKDLTSIQSNSQMIVLSACGTGLGKQMAGEGLMSLGRAFVACGAKSIVTSLWNIIDISGKDIMVSFYSHLKNKTSKFEALNQAKVEYLQNAKTRALAHPYYWSAFILIGDGTPINIAKNYWVLFGYSGLIFLGILFFAIRKRKAKI